MVDMLSIIKCDKCGNHVYAGIENQPDSEIRLYIVCENEDCDDYGNEYSKYFSYDDFMK